jgi:hypothetical protein
MSSASSYMVLDECGTALGQTDRYGGWSSSVVSDDDGGHGGDPEEGIYLKSRCE